MLKAVIVEDEPNAREKLQLILQRYCPDVRVLAQAANAAEGLTAIRDCRPDIVFLDIEMPLMTGFEMLQQIPKIDFEIIFTTAHDNYAIRAIQFSALDYLLKPVDFEQLQLAVKKAAERRMDKHSLEQYRTLQENLQKPQHAMDQLAVPSQAGMIFIKIPDITYCEASSNYTRIHLANQQQLLSSRTLKDYEQMLEESGFVRIHHSYLVNKSHVRQYVSKEGGQVQLKDGTMLDVSRRKKEQVLEKLGKH